MLQRELKGWRKPKKKRNRKIGVGWKRGSRGVLVYGERTFLKREGGRGDEKRLEESSICRRKGLEALALPEDGLLTEGRSREEKISPGKDCIRGTPRQNRL